MAGIMVLRGPGEGYNGAYDDTYAYVSWEAGILSKKHDRLGPRDWLITILKTRNLNISFYKTWLQARGMVLYTLVLQLNVNIKTGSK